MRESPHNGSRDSNDYELAINRAIM